VVLSDGDNLRQGGIFVTTHSDDQDSGKSPNHSVHALARLLHTPQQAKEVLPAQLG